MSYLNKPVAAICLAVASAFVHAQEVTYDFNLPAQPASQMLNALSKQTGLQPFFSEASVKGMQSNAVKGKLTLREALDRALAGTGLSYQFTGEKSVAIRLAAVEKVTELPTLIVNASPETSEGQATLPSGSEADLSSGLRAATSDTASLLRDVPGVSLYGAGGVSSLPVIHGLADDRLRIKTDGVDAIASCPNHMNSPLSYVDPTNVGSVIVYAGVTPVSVGGDSIGGSIIVETPASKFAAPGQGRLFEGEIGAFYRSNGNANGANLSATYATESLSFNFTAATAKSDDYQAGGNYKHFTLSGAAPRVAADTVGSSAFKSRNQSLNLAFKGDRHLLEFKYTHQDIPYEWYPNQRMDMLANDADRINLRYLGQMDWGSLEARVYHERVKHFMDYGEDKLYLYGTLSDLHDPSIKYPVGGMPMYTRSKTTGASIKADINLSPRNRVHIGADLQNYRLDDWWPPAPDCGVGNCLGGMAPDTFWNINNGKRDRLGIFGELESRWSQEWLTLAGVRFEHVTTDTGPVQGYNSYYATSSVGTLAAFNTMDRKHTDDNVDFTWLTRYTPNANATYEIGYARKTRSPNLYERYDWSTSSMALEMNNFVGDGNGYLGKPDLRPEVAHTLSITGDWHSVDGEYQFQATPYYTHVKDYIDAVRYPGMILMYINGVMSRPSSLTLKNAYVLLQYANHDARLYGIDLSGRMPLGKTQYGNFALIGLLNYTNGKNLDSHDGLYNIMPLNAKLTLTHRFGGWNNRAELVMVKGKSNVSEVRNEIKTPGFSLVNLRASYTTGNLRFDFGVENLFNRLYYLPLGGAYTGEGATMSMDREVGHVTNSSGTTGTETTWGTAVPGSGRSLYIGMNYKF